MKLFKLLLITYEIVNSLMFIYTRWRCKRVTYIESYICFKPMCDTFYIMFIYTRWRCKWMTYIESYICFKPMCDTFYIMTPLVYYLVCTSKTTVKIWYNSILLILLYMAAACCNILIRMKISQSSLNTVQNLPPKNK